MKTKRTLTLLAAAAFGLGSALAQCEFTVWNNPTNPTCGQNNGSIAFTLFGGVPPYTLTYENGTTVFTGAVNPSNVLRSGLGAGFYQVFIHDASESNCNLKQSNQLDCEQEPENCEYRTQTMGGWGAPPHGNNPAKYLRDNFSTCFPTGITVGCATGYTLKLTSSTAVKNFLPSGGTPAVLNGNMVNPTSYGNVFAGQLVAAVINVTLDYCKPDFSPSTGWSGNLVYNTGTFAGLTVEQVIAAANERIGGCGGSYSAAQLSGALAMFNENFDDGTTDLGNFSCPNDGEQKDLEAPEVEVSKLYPNPASESITVVLNPTADATVTLSVLDLTGREVLNLGRMTLSGGESRSLNINVEGLSKGSYLLVATLNAKQIAVRFVVNH